MSRNATSSRNGRHKTNLTPPHNADAERALIGELMLMPEFIGDVRPLVRPEDFHLPAQAEMFRAILAVAQGGKPVDPVSVAEELHRRGKLADVGGDAALIAAMEAIPHGAHAKYHASVIAEKSARRQIIYRGTDLLKIAWDETIPNDDVLTYIDGLGAHLSGHCPDPFPLMSAGDLDKSTATVEYLVEWLLVRGQPCIVAGGKKCLKTNLLIDLALSLSNGGRFLGVFSVPKPVRVAMLSGESGQATIQETARRIARSKGYSLDSFSRASFGFTLPNINDPAHLAAMERLIVSNQLEVLILDPAYLMMPLGDAAGNLFLVGAMLKGLAEIAQRTGCTLILCHHTRKNVVNPFEPPELEDIAWAGFQEFARQWLLIGRREKYDPEQGGSHRLWLNAGGSAGHSSLSAIDIEEGTRQDDGGRRWQTAVMTGTQARAEASETATAAKDEAKDRKRHEQLQRDREKLLAKMAKFPTGQTKTLLRDTSGLHSTRFNAALATLLEEKAVIPCTVTSGNGHKYDGYNLTGDDPGQSTGDTESPVKNDTPGILPL